MAVKKILLAAVTAAAVFGAVGCTSTDRPLPPEPQFSQRDEVRAAELRQALAVCPNRILVVRPGQLLPEYLLKPEAIIEHAGKLGFNRINVMLGEDDDPDREFMSRLFKAAHKADMKIGITIRQTDFVKRFRSTAVLRHFAKAGTSLPEIAENLADFIDSQPDDEKISAVTVIIEPQAFVKGRPENPKDLLFVWSNGKSGKDSDNDQIVEYTMRNLRIARDELAPTPLIIGVPDFLHDMVGAGLLKYGTVQDFLDISGATPGVALLSTGNKPSEVLDGVTAELNSTKDPGSLLVAVYLAEHSSVEKGALRKRNWADFIRAIDYAINEWQKNPAFGGVALGPFTSLESILKED
ncbi:MAG: hypothetical protein PHI35_07520 [Victivallaceae bacterium]|nr:hypothetical protein [Victivallaceae bacterium]